MIPGLPELLAGVFLIGLGLGAMYGAWARDRRHRLDTKKQP